MLWRAWRLLCILASPCKQGPQPIDPTQGCVQDGETTAVWLVRLRGDVMAELKHTYVNESN